MKILLSFVSITLLTSGILVSCDISGNDEIKSSSTIPTPSRQITTESSTVKEISPTTTSTAEPTTSSTAEPTTSSTAEPTTSSTAEPTTSSTAEPTTSTAEPTTSSTAVPTTSSTAVPSTTIVSSTEMPVPSPQECVWNVTDNNGTCIRVKIAAIFKIPIEGTTYYIALNQNATSEGSTCFYVNDTQKFEVSEFEKYTLTMIFKKDPSQVFVESTIFSYNLTAGQDTVYNSDKLFVVKAGNSYLCKSQTNIKLGNVTMEITDIHIQAFAPKDNTDFGSAEECGADDKVNSVVPVAVGVALAALIIIVLIAYLVGRRQSRQKGYQSV